MKSIRWPDLVGYMVNRHDKAAKTTDKIPTIRLWDLVQASGGRGGGYSKWPLVKFKELALSTPLDITYMADKIFLVLFPNFDLDK